MRGERTVIAVVGGSITVGHGASDGFSWPTYFENWLKDAFPNANVSFHNGAVAGTKSDYMCACHSSHIPHDADLVIIEYGHNDVHHPSEGNNLLMDNVERRPMERLLRRLLEYPRRPALVFLNVLCWFETKSYGLELDKMRGLFYDNAESDFSEFSWYYSLPSVSVKAGVYPLMLANVSGFRVDKCCRFTPEDRLELLGQSFFSDGVHPAGDTGARVMAELLIHLLMKVVDGIKALPTNEEDNKAASEPLPRPMIPGNYPSMSDRCLLGAVLVNATLEPHEGWTWMDDRRRGQGRQPKLGFVSVKPGSIIQFKVDTRITVGLQADGDKKNGTVEIGIAHLRSYEHNGRGTVSCLGGCQCMGDMTLEGLDTTRKVSQLHIHSGIKATQSSNCIIQVAVSNSTGGTGHKVKISGIFIAEEAGGDNRITAAVSRGALDTITGLKINPSDSQ